MRYHTIVVGAGPAGSTAAYHLARGGAKTLLLEAKKLPILLLLLSLDLLCIVGLTLFTGTGFPIL